LLDKTDYNYAVITGPNRDYLWILARNPQLSTDVQTAVLQKARDAGFQTERLIWVKQKSL
jgi:apolipoprotein D and lipocalin family protein